MAAKSPLFPEIEPYATHHIAVGEGHTLYVEESGNPKGLPAIVLHGGPGAGCNAKHRRRFNPKKYRIVCFDQRGCGRSLAENRLAANTTRHLVEDIATIRMHLGIGQPMLVYGTSWGSALALAYAQTYPETVRAMVLGGIFLGTREETEWMSLPTHAARFYPLEYQALLSLLGNPPPPQIISTLYLALTGDNPDFARQTAAAWTLFECLCAVPAPNRAEIDKFIATTSNLQEHAALEYHYFNSDCFLEPGQLLANCNRIAHIPTTILQGQLDFICPPTAAYSLHAELPQSTLTVIPNCGHMATDEMDAARIAATNSFIV